MNMILPADRCLVADASWGRVRRQAEDHGAAVYELDCRDIVDRASFLERAGLELPADPATAFTKWSALSDALWSGLAAQPTATVVYGWRHVDGLVAHGLLTLLTALEVVSDLQRTGAEPVTAGLEAPLELFVVLTGEGPNFPGDPAG